MWTRWIVLPLVGMVLLAVRQTGADPGSDKAPPASVQAMANAAVASSPEKKPAAKKATDDDPFAGSDEKPVKRPAAKKAAVPYDPFGMDAPEPTKKPAAKKVADDSDPFGGLDDAKPAGKAARKPAKKNADALYDPLDGKPEANRKAQPKSEDSRTAKERGEKPAASEKHLAPTPLLLSSMPPTEAMRRALDKRIGLEFMKIPLSHVVEFLKGELRIPIWLDVRALDDVGMDPCTLVTCNLRDVSARSALNLVLAEFDLTWTISNEVLLITTPERANSMLHTIVYDVHDLVAIPDEAGTSFNDFDQLIDVITSTIEPNTWDAVGGPGSIAPFEGHGIAALSVSQTQPVHEQIEKLLADLRKLRRPQPGIEKRSQETGRVSATSSSEMILRALEKRIDVDCVATPLSDAVGSLGDNLKVPVLLHRKALSDVGVAPDAPIDFRLRGVSARSALNLMLSQLHLTWTLSNEVVLITTPEKADAIEVVVVYDVHDLVVVPDGMGKSVSDFDSLLDLITCTISPTAWPTGRVPISTFAHNGISALCILQSREVHEEIAKLLADLREARRAKATGK